MRFGARMLPRGCLEHVETTQVVANRPAEGRFGSGDCADCRCRGLCRARDCGRCFWRDLDQTIQELSGERGVEDETCVRLTGIYHNLIRRLAEV